MIENIILSRLGKSLRLKAIGRRDIETLHISLKATPYRANRVLPCFRKCSASQSSGSGNPTKRIPKFHEEKRERCLSTTEIQRFREALDRYPDQNAANPLRLLLLTVSRAGEVLKAEWEHFDFARGVWTKRKRTEFPSGVGLRSGLSMASWISQRKQESNGVFVAIGPLPRSGGL
jgi:integrase